MDDSPRLARATAKSHASDARADRDRAERNTLIVDILDRKAMTQADVCRVTGLTREHVRRIVDAEHQRRAHDPAPE